MANPDLDNPSIVLLGSFNPAIFQPMWFAHFGLLREEEGKTASIKMLTPEVTVFQTDWLRLEVMTNRFAAVAKDTGHSLALRDLVVGTFRLLEHTPFSALGLNRYSHYKTASEDSWHKVGDTLAPKKFWEGLLEGRIGMRSLTIEALRPGSPAKWIRVKVEPSLQVKNGVFFDVNEHYEVTENGSEKALVPGNAPKYLELIETHFEANQEFALRAAEHIFDRTR
jgi:hypothetical protein